MFRFHGFLKRHKTGSTFSALLAVSIILMSITSPNVAVKPKEIGITLFSIFQIASSETGSFFRRTVTSIRELKKLQSEHEILQEKLIQYRIIERDLVELRQENEKLKVLLEFSDTIEYRHIPSAIIGKDPGNFFDSITINKGSVHGVRKDMTVIAYQDGFQGLVGKVVNVGAFSSIIMPIFDVNSFVAARLQGSRYEGLVNGSGLASGNIYLRHVIKRAREEISYGDIIITSGMGGVYPKGIYIGRVRAISAKEWEPSLELEVEPIVNFARLEYVFVLQGEEQ